MHYNGLTFWSSMVVKLKPWPSPRMAVAKMEIIKTNFIWCLQRKRRENTNEFAFTFKYILRSQDVHSYIQCDAYFRKIPEKLTTLACRCSKRQLNILFFLEFFSDIVLEQGLPTPFESYDSQNENNSSVEPANIYGILSEYLPKTHHM